MYPTFPSPDFKRFKPTDKNNSNEIGLGVGSVRKISNLFEYLSEEKPFVKSHKHVFIGRLYFFAALSMNLNSLLSISKTVISLARFVKPIANEVKSSSPIIAIFLSFKSP